MKKLVFLALSLYCIAASAQDVVSLVVSADGPTKTQAIDNALRSAIEQTYGTFVSANTQILNDQLVKDEIATVSSGNIQKYTEIAAVTLSNGNTSVTLNVTVSLKKLVKYAKNKGSECEFAGATLGANLRQLQFRYDNSKKALEHLKEYTRIVGSRVFDYEIKVGKPQSGMGNMMISVTVKYIPNSFTKEYFKTVLQTLDATAFSEEDVTTLMGVDYMKYQFFPITGLVSRTYAYSWLCDRYKYSESFLERIQTNGRFHWKQFPDKIILGLNYNRPVKGGNSLMDVFERYVINGFVIKDNNGNIIEIPELNGFYEIDPPIDMGYIFIETLASFEKGRSKKGGSVSFKIKVPIEQLSNITKFIVEPK